MTVPGGVLAVLAMLSGLLRDLTQLAVSPETRWYAAPTGTPRKLDMRKWPSS